eukprot:562979-Pyramimonas_sp.AAC.1
MAHLHAGEGAGLHRRRRQHAVALRPVLRVVAVRDSLLRVRRCPQLRRLRCDDVIGRAEEYSVDATT